MNSESELCRKADFSLMISERIRQIYKELTPVTAILKLLADTSIIDQHLFDLMDQNDIVKLAVKLKMVTQLNDVKVLLKDCRNVLEDIDVSLLFLFFNNFYDTLLGVIGTSSPQQFIAGLFACYGTLINTFNLFMFIIRCRFLVHCFTNSECDNFVQGVTPK